MESRKVIKTVLGTLIIAAVSLFFWRELQHNWLAIQEHRGALEVPFILLSALAILCNCLINTYSWFVTLNALSATGKITLPQSIATCNTSNLTKYLPGKVWSYALQTYWLARAGFSKSLVLYVYLVNTFVSLITFMIAGTAFLMLAPERSPLALTVPLLAALIIADLCFLRYNEATFHALLAAVKRLFKVDAAYFEAPKGLLMRLHLLYLAGACSLGAGAWLMCFGIGLPVGTNAALPVMASMMISDVIGFVAIIVPGGLGVREGVMYSLLHGVSSDTLSLLLPVATRIANMLVDLSLGAVGLVLLRRMTAAGETRGDA